MNLKEEIEAEENVFSGKIFSVKKYTVRLPDGSESFREEVEHTGGACVLCLDGDDVLLVRQYRLSLRRETLEIPAGKLEKGEDPLSCAKRELSEEAGLEAVRIEKILSVNPSPGYTDETIHIYYCGEYIKSASHLDEGEFLNLVRINKQRCFEMVESGEIADGKTVAALLWLKSRRKTSS